MIICLAAEKKSQSGSRLIYGTVAAEHLSLPLSWTSPVQQAILFALQIYKTPSKRISWQCEVQVQHQIPILQMAMALQILPTLLAA